MAIVQRLARRYDQYAASLYDRFVTNPRRHGLDDVRAFSAWMETCWYDLSPPAPPTAPAAVSDGRWGTICWHETRTAVLGDGPGRPGGYRVPVDQAPPGIGRRPLRVRLSARAPRTDDRPRDESNSWSGFAQSADDGRTQQ